MATDNLAIVRRLVDDVLNKGIHDTADELMSKDVTLHHSLAGDLRGVDTVKQYYRSLRIAFPDLNLSIEDIGVAGEKAFCRLTLTGTHKGSLLGMTATNKRVSVPVMAIVHLQGGRIVENWVMFEALGMVQQLGLVAPLDKLRPAATATARPH